MANFQTGTIRLEPPWVENGASNSGSSWELRITGAVAVASTANPNGWGVNIISGSFGANDLVVDLVPPSGLKGQTAYDVAGRFSHRSQGRLWYQQFNFSITELRFANEPRMDVVRNERTGEFISAVLEQDGVQLYRYSDDITDKTELAFVQHGLYPNVWLDDDGGLWLYLIENTDPKGLSSTHRLYRSRDGGETITEQYNRTWEQPPGTAQNTLVDNAVIFPSVGTVARGILVAFTRVQLVLYVSQSFDNGVTWSEPESLTLGGISTLPTEAPQRMPGEARAALFRNWVFYSEDMGETWPEYSVYPGGAQTVSRAGFGYGGLVMITGQNNDNAIFRSAHTPGLSVAPDSWGNAFVIAESTDRSTFKPIIGLDGFIYATNGRDKLCRSADGGQNWSTL